MQSEFIKSQEKFDNTIKKDAILMSVLAVVTLVGLLVTFCIKY